MKTTKKLKLLLGFFLTILFSCEQDLEIQEDGQFNIRQEDYDGKRSISIEQIPEVEKFIQYSIASKKGYKYGKGQNSSGSMVVTPFGNIPLNNITEVIDTLGSANYTFRLLPDSYIGNRFFNIIVHKTTETDDISSYVLEYEMADSFAEGYANGNANFSNFTGKLKRYGLEEFLEGAEKGKLTRKTCEQEGISPISFPSCEETPFDNGAPSGDDGDISDPTDGTDSGTGSGGGSSGGGSSGGGSGGIPPGVVCAMGGLYVTGCGGTNSGTQHLAVSCGGNLGIATFYNLMVCSDGSSNFEELKGNVSGKGSSCGGPGPVAIEPVPFYKLSFSLNLPEQLSTWLDQNCDLKNQIYSFLNRNVNSNGDWSENAKQRAIEIIIATFNGSIISAFPFVKYPTDKAAQYRRDYPKLTEYLQNELPKLADNPSIVNAFKQYTNMTDTQVRETLTWGDGPNLLVEDLGFDNRGNPISGKFEEPDILKIDIDMVNFLQNSTSGSEHSETILLAIGMTILHEAVHYGDYNYNNDFYTGNNPYTNEEGWLFEQEVYEFSIFVSASGEFTIIPWN